MAHIVGLGLTFVAEKVDVKLVALVQSILKLPLPNTIKTVLISVVDVFFNGRLWTTSNQPLKARSNRRVAFAKCQVMMMCIPPILLLWHLCYLMSVPMFT